MHLQGLLPQLGPGYFFCSFLAKAYLIRFHRDAPVSPRDSGIIEIR